MTIAFESRISENLVSDLSQLINDINSLPKKMQGVLSIKEDNFYLFEIMFDYGNRRKEGKIRHILKESH